MGREKDLAEETVPLVGKLDDYEKEYGIPLLGLLHYNGYFNRILQQDISRRNCYGDCSYHLPQVYLKLCCCGITDQAGYQHSQC